MPDAALSPAAPATGRTGLLAELGTLAAHAGTVLIGQLAVMAFSVTDTVVAGRYSEAALAALAVGTAVYVSVYVGLMGLVQALMPVWAELHGGQRPAAVGPSVRQALYLSALTSAVGMACLLSPGPLLEWTGVPAALKPEVRRYLAVLAWALPPALLFRLYSTLNQALGKPRLVSALQLVALGVKVPLSVWFAFGGAGVPPLGAVGCAWATLVVNWVLLALAVWLVRTQDFYRAYALWAPLERPDGAQLAAFARLGVPAALAILVEVGAYTAMALFVSRLGTTAAAAHQIAANVAAVVYMVPLALGIATSARASFWLGAARADLAARSAWLGLASAMLLAVGTAALLVLAARPIAGLYVQQPAVAALAAGLLGAVACYHLADAAQAVCVFTLRSYRITVRPLAIYGVVLWGAGIPLGYRWAFDGIGPWPPRASPDAFWLASAAALAVVAVLFIALLAHATRRRVA